MGVQEPRLPDGELRVRNVGGIEETAVEFTPGVNLLVGRNATNRTSLLQAFMAAMGSDNVTVKGDADEARVELDLADETYTRHLRRDPDGVVTDGDPYLDGSELADLFAFLLESNELRRAVERGDELHDIILRPVDTEELQAEIDRLVEERDRVGRELDEIDQLKGELPGKEQRRNELEAEIADKREALEAKEAELSDADDVERRQQQKQELEENLDELSSLRSDLEDVRYELETERERLTELRNERNDLQADLEDLAETPDGELDAIDEEVRQLRERKQRLESEVSELRSVISFNEDVLDGAGPDALSALGDDAGDVTDQLVADDVTCWTCGSSVDRGQIEATIGQLRAFSAEKLDEVDAIESELDAKQSRRRELEDARRERERAETQLEGVESELERCEANIDRLEDRRNDLVGEVQDVEAVVEELEAKEYSDILEHHREANELEYELGRLEQDLDAVEDEIAEIECRIGEEADLRARREDLDEEITALRTKIERIEQDTVEQFNDHMETVLELLDYDNLDRVWLERREREVTEGRRTLGETAFDLHVVRTTESGTAYEDTVDHLSESEREITGLILALAGFLAHEVYDDVPYILLDSLEAIDSARIAKLVEYVAEYADYLVVALLTEDAQAVDEEYHRITDI